MSRIALIGTFDTKANEFDYLQKLIKRHGYDVYAIDIGARLVKTPFIVDLRICNRGSVVTTNFANNDALGCREKYISETTTMISDCIAELVFREELVAIVGMAGATGSSIIARAMRALPIGIPKILVSTTAGLYSTDYIDETDIVLVPSVVDISGLNVVTKRLFISVASMVCSLARNINIEKGAKPTIALTMLGNTTGCCDLCRKLLLEKGFEVIVFHATGIGGKNMERMIDCGIFDGVLDLTTTEIINHELGGMFSAGPGRLRSAISNKIPLVVAPGGIDMIMFRRSSKLQIPFSRRKTYLWNNDIVLVRTSKAENIRAAEIIAEKTITAKGRLSILIPRGGFSFLGQFGNPFYSPVCDAAFAKTVLELVGGCQEVKLLEGNINSREFAREAVNAFLKQWGKL